jgi:UDP-glucose 4-epimerase
VVILGDGRHIRDYVYVDDVVKALAAAATAEGINRQTINIGAGYGTTVTGLVQLMEHVTGKQARIITNPQESGGVSCLVADTSRAAAMLGYQPEVSLAQGLAWLIARDPQFAG